MSDTSRTIVPLKANYSNRKETSEDIVNWLVSINAVKAERTDCVLSSELGYSLGKDAIELVNESDFLPYGLIINGLDVITERTIFHSDLDSFICPKCKTDIVDDDWSSFLDDYIENGNSLTICPVCNEGNELNDYVIEPAWGFSNLGFTFWNWPDFTQSFLNQFETRLNCKVRVIVSRI